MVKLKVIGLSTMKMQGYQNLVGTKMENATEIGKEYHSNGKLKGEGKYANDKKVNVWKMYYYDGIDENE